AEAVAYIRKHLEPVATVDEKRLATLIANLDSDEFAVRDRAAKELEKLGEAAAGACRKALQAQPSPEARRRLEALVRRQMDQAWNPSADRLRTLRVLEFLELAATPEARELLAKLANGAPGAWLTGEAKAGLERVDKRRRDREPSKQRQQ